MDCFFSLFRSEAIMKRSSPSTPFMPSTKASMVSTPDMGAETTTWTAGRDLGVSGGVMRGWVDEEPESRRLGVFVDGRDLERDFLWLSDDE